MLGWRYRELYATKSTFIMLALEDEADAKVIEAQVTHQNLAPCFRGKSPNSSSRDGSPSLLHRLLQ
jgi:hypothetical protein